METDFNIPKLQPAPVKKKGKFMHVFMAVALIAIIVATFWVIFDKANESSEEQKSKLIPNIASQTIEWNGQPLFDSTFFNEQTNTCTASRHGMETTIWPCVAQDVDGIDIEQFVNFTWTGAQPQNTSWIFVYDEGQLESGKMFAWQNISYETQVPGFQWISNHLIDNVVSYQNLGAPSGSCDLGSLNNTQMYDVTRLNPQNQTNYVQRICFTSVTPVNATAFRVSGNIDIMEPSTAYRMDWNDVSSAIQYMGFGLLNDNRSYYKTQNVQFQPGQTIATRWEYTPQNKSLAGKWHILGHDTQTGLTQALATNQYIYVDPWWNSDWKYKKEILIQENSANNLNNYSVQLFVEYNSNMNNDFSDLMFTNNTEDGELGYWIESKNDGVNATVWVKVPELTASQNTSIFMYYGNALAESNSNKSLAFLLWADTPDEFSANFNKLQGSDSVFSGEGLNFINGDSPGATSLLSKNALNHNLEIQIRNLIPSATGTNWMQMGYRHNGSSFTTGTFVDGTTNSGFRVAFSKEHNRYQFLKNGDMLNDQFGTFSDGWQNWTINVWGGNHTFKKDGVIQLSRNDQNTYVSFPNQYLAFAARDGLNDGQVDTLRVRSYIYPEPTYTIGAEEMKEGVLINLNSPANNLNTTSSSINFNATITPRYATIKNVTLYLNDEEYLDLYETNETINYSKILTLEDGDYTWNITACWIGESTTENCTESETRTFRIDTLLPVINIDYPANGTEIATLTLPYNVTFNVSIIENNPQACWFFNGSQNVTFTCGQNVSQLYGAGYHTTPFYANDTAGNVNSNSTTFLINLISPNVIFPSPVVEAQNFNVTFNLTAGLITTVNATLNYNGTLVPMNLISQNSTFATFRASTTALSNISGNILMPLFINYTLNGNSYSTSQQNQTVRFLTPIIVAASCNDKSLAFDFKDEQNLAAGTGSINYNFQFGISENNTLKSVYGSLSSVSSFYVCINSTVSNSYVIGSGEIQYRINETFVERRNYQFTNKILSNVTENITLFDLKNSDATSFLIEAKDNTLQPYVEKYLGLLRWYPAQNTYNLVEMAQTDQFGRSIFRVKVEDVDYRVALWEKNGTLIKLNDPTRFACLTAPCTYSFTVNPGDSDFTSITGIQQSLTFNETTNTFTFVWNDPSQKTTSMNLTVYRETGVNVGQICSVQGSGYVGAIACDVTGQNGQLRAVVFRSASPATPIASLVYTIGQAISNIAADMGLLIAAILAIAGFFIGIFSPITGIILQIAALIPAMYLGAVSISIIIGLAIMGVVIIHFMKRVIGG